MNAPAATDPTPPAAPAKNKWGLSGLLQSGIVFTAINFVTGLGNGVFQAILGRHLKAPGDYGHANSALSGLMTLLGLVPTMAIFAVTHYIAHYKACGDLARLEGLLRGCQRFVFHLTLAGSVLAVLAVEPLHKFFDYDERLTLVTLFCTLLGLWASFATALCQGLAWFKRLALIGLLAVILRVTFGWFITFKWPSAETAVLAQTFALLAYLVLLFWRKDLSLHGEPLAPWNREFAYFFIVSMAFVVGNFCFVQGDYLVANKFFPETDLDAYAATSILARALPQTIAPLLTVLFTSRSGQRTGSIVSEQFKLIGLSIFALFFGAICLFVLRIFFLKLLGRYTAESAGMVAPFCTAMVFVGLLQTLGTWSLASRWIKLALLYCGLGVAYWLSLLFWGTTPANLLHTMPLAAGIAFVSLFLFWLIAMRAHSHAPHNQ